MRNKRSKAGTFCAVRGAGSAWEEVKGELGVNFVTLGYIESHVSTLELIVICHDCYTPKNKAQLGFVMVFFI